MRPPSPPHIFQDGFTGLYLASEKGHLEVVRLLLDKGANVDAANQVRPPPAHMTSSHASGREGGSRACTALFLTHARTHSRTHLFTRAPFTLACMHT